MVNYLMLLCSVLPISVCSSSACVMLLSRKCSSCCVKQRKVSAQCCQCCWFSCCLSSVDIRTLDMVYILVVVMVGVAHGAGLLKSVESESVSKELRWLI